MSFSFDNHKNFAASTVATAPSPSTSGTTIVVATGAGARFPAPPFNCVVCPARSIPTALNAEIVRVTVKSTDTLTVTRTQEGTSARAITVGDQIFVAATNKTLTDIESAITELTAGNGINVRFKSGKGFQWYNTTTGLWHTKQCVENPPRDAWDAGEV